MLAEVLHQWDRRWRGKTLGHGPSTFWGGACVLFGLVHAARALKTSPALDPPHANELFRQAGAFDGDLLRVHDAAPTIGLVAPLAELVTIEHGQEALEAALYNAFGVGGALLRIDMTGDGKGDHTVFAHDVIPRPNAEDPDTVDIDIADSAALNGRERLLWPGLTGAVKWGDNDTRRYRVVAVRPVRRKDALPI